MPRIYPDGTPLDPRTGRPFGDHGTAQAAIDYVLSNDIGIFGLEAEAFLRSWNEGNLTEWPDYYEWLAKREL